MLHGNLIELPLFLSLSSIRTRGDQLLQAKTDRRSYALVRNTCEQHITYYGMALSMQVRIAIGENGRYALLKGENVGSFITL